MVVEDGCEDNANGRGGVQFMRTREDNGAGNFTDAGATCSLRKVLAD